MSRSWCWQTWQGQAGVRVVGGGPEVWGGGGYQGVRTVGEEPGVEEGGEEGWRGARGGGGG